MATGAASTSRLSPGRRRDVTRPAGPHERKSLAEQEAIPRVREVCRIVVRRRIVKLGENADIAAVVDLVEQGIVAAGRVHRTQHEKIGAERDQAAPIAWGKLEIGDLALAGAAGSSANKARPRSFSYAPDEPNDVRRREVLAFQDFKPLNACLRMRYRHHQREQQLRNATAERAVAAHSGWHLTRA